MIKKGVTLALKVTVSLTLIWFLLDGIDIDIAAAKKQIVKISPEMLILACAIFVFQIVFAVLRWQAVLTAIQSPLSFLKALQFAYIGVFSIKLCRPLWAAMDTWFKTIISSRRAGDVGELISNPKRLMELTNWTPKHANLRDIISSSLRLGKN